MATPTSITTITPTTTAAIKPALSDLGSKTAKLLNYYKYHTLKNLTYLAVFRAPLN